MLLRRFPRSAIALSLLTTLAAFAAGCGGADEHQGPLPGTPAHASTDAACSFALTIDPSIAPNPSTLPGPDGKASPIAATRDGDGVTTNVLADVVILRPVDQAELTAFLAEYAGVVTGDDSVPPRAGGGGGLPATSYVIRLDPTTFPLTNIAADAVAFGYCGALIVSSDAAAHLFALSFHEGRAGRKVGLDFLASGAGP